MVTKKTSYISESVAEFEHILSAEMSDQFLDVNTRLNALQKEKKELREKCGH